MSLSLVTKTTRGRKYLKLVDITYEKLGNGKYKRHEEIKINYGNLDKFIEQDPDAYENLRAKYSKPDIKYKKNFTEEEVIEIAKGNASNFKSESAIPFKLSYATVIPRFYWKEVLKITPLIKRMQKKTKKVNDVDEILNYFCSTKIVNPNSVYSTYKNINSEVSITTNCNENDITRSLAFFYDNKERLMSHIFKRVGLIRKRKIKLIFFDTTNFYFEKLFDDLQEYQHDIIKKLKNEIRNNLIKEKYEFENNDALEAEVLKQATDRAYEIIELEKKKNKEEVLEVVSGNKEKTLKFFKMKGPCKSHRYDLPIISIGLAIDEEGIPIDYKIFPGNTHDTKTIEPFVNDFKAKYKIKECIMVSDKGINSFASINMINANEYGFIIANSVYKFSEDIEDQILTGEGFEYFTKNDIKTFSTDEDFISDSEDVKYKVIKLDKNGKVYNDDKSKKINKTISYSLVITFSEKRKKRDLAQIDLDVYKATQAVKNKTDLSSISQSGWRSLVIIEAKEKKNTDKTNNKKTEETSSEQTAAPQAEDTTVDSKKSDRAKKTMYKAVKVDTAKIERRRMLAGYSAIIFKDPDNTDEPLEPQRVLQAYRDHVYIESCFRVLKSEFNLRPEYLRNIKNIDAYVGICIISLIILRLIQLDLKEKNVIYTVKQITSILKSAEIIAVSDDGKEGYFVNSNSFEASGFDTKIDTYKENILAYKNNKTELNKILKTLGFGEIKTQMGSRDFANALKIQIGYKNIVGTVVSDIQNPNFEKEYEEKKLSICNLQINQT